MLPAIEAFEHQAQVAPVRKHERPKKGATAGKKLPPRGKSSFTTSLAETEKKKSQYSIQQLPDLSTETLEKYFGDTAKEMYYSAYKQLKSRSEIMAGGYDELDDTLYQNPEESYWSQSIQSLEQEGVLTPRDGRRVAARSTSINRRLTSRGSASRLPIDRDLGLTKEEMFSFQHMAPPDSWQIIDKEQSLFQIQQKVKRVESPPITGSKPETELETPLQQSSWSADESSTTKRPFTAPAVSAGLNDSLDLFESSMFSNPPPLNLDDRSYVDKSMEMSFGVTSPRAVFLSGCLRHGVPPITSALLRKRITSTINLAHMGIGNKVGLILSDCLSTLPYLQVLNLSDNHLEDSGLAALIDSIRCHKDIEILDISQNVIGSDAAQALGKLIGNKDCRLKCLRMSDANIDDGECAKFVEVLMHNVHLKELDLSKNLLGKDENLNAVQPDFVTGGESLSELIKHGDCPLEVLNLHWNMIRLEGAEVLCNSIRFNDTLLQLDLSYNALGSAAAVVLGSALLDNKTLKTLNVANNGIDGIGAFTICVGIRENRTLHHLTLDGNPIGEMGGRILMKLAASDGHRVTVSAANCDITIKSTNALFRPDAPYGSYELDMKQPYHRAVMLDMLNIVHYDASVQISSMEFAPFNQFSAVNLVKYEVETSALSDTEREELALLQSIAKLNQMPMKTMMNIVHEYDNGYEMMKTTDFPQLFKQLGLIYSEVFVKHIKFALDPWDNGVVDINELLEFFGKRSHIAVERIHDLTHRIWTYDPDSIRSPIHRNRPPERYLPPSYGTIKITLSEGYLTSDTFRCSPLSFAKCQQIITAVDKATDPLDLLLYALDSTILYFEEAQILYHYILTKTEDKVVALSRILLRMHVASDAMMMIKSIVNNDVVQLRRLKKKLGSAYFPIVGIYSGYYNLDLSNPADRLCLKKLIEKSVQNDKVRRDAGLGDVSQTGNGSCFRNEYHHGDEDKVRSISPRYFNPIPQKGRVEFDFVNIERPDPRICRGVHEDRIIDTLLLSRLLEEAQVDYCIHRMTEMSIANRKGFLSNGSPYWRADIGRAMMVGDMLYSMYSNLPQRRASLAKSAKREIIKTQTPSLPVSATKAGADKRKGPATRAKRFNNAKKTADELMMSDKAKENLIKFRSVVNQGLAVRSKMIWKRRMHEVMVEGNGSDEYKCLALMEFFESELCNLWLYCKYLAIILEVFAIGATSKSILGSYRVELIVMLFDCIVDLYNFELVLMVLSAEEQAAVHARIGILNFFNPCKPEGGWQFDLMQRDERQVVKMLIHLSVVEPGENWLNKGFIFDHGFPPNPGWDLTVTWFTEEGLPKKGILSLEMFAGDGMNLLGCKVNKDLRNTLTAVCLVPHRNLQCEIENETMLTEERAQAFKKGDKTPTNMYPELHMPGMTRPTLPLLKLLTQYEMFAALDGTDAGQQNVTANNTVVYTLQDANIHLTMETDIKWNYSAGSNKAADSWVGGSPGKPK